MTRFVDQPSLAAQEFVLNMRHFVQSSDVPSDFNLTSFSLWVRLSEAEERREVESLYTDLCNYFLSSD